MVGRLHSASSRDIDSRQGNLALSRAMGDFEFKQNFSLEPEKQIVSIDPDVITHQSNGEEEFLVLACDGQLAFK